MGSGLTGTGRRTRFPVGFGLGYSGGVGNRDGYVVGDRARVLDGAGGTSWDVRWVVFTVGTVLVGEGFTNEVIRWVGDPIKGVDGVGRAGGWSLDTRGLLGRAVGCLTGRFRPSGFT